MDLPFEQIWAGFHSPPADGEPRVLVARSAAGWQRAAAAVLSDAHPLARQAPAVDFATHAVVLVWTGETSGHDYLPALRHLRRTAGGLELAVAMEPVAEPTHLDVVSATLWVGTIPAAAFADGAALRYREGDQAPLAIVPELFD